MSKETLNLSIEKSIKQRAKEIARKKGISVSRFFEQLIAKQKEPEKYSPKPGSAAYELSRLLPASVKAEEKDYDELKWQAIKEKYEIE